MGRTLPFDEKMVKRLKSHASLRLRSLINSRKNPARFEERHELRKQIGGNERNPSLRIKLLESPDDRYRIRRAHVYGSKHAVVRHELSGLLIRGRLIIVSFNYARNRK